MKKRTFSTELCYILGILLLAFSATCMAKADLGLSMVVAPAYLLHLKCGISFGTAECLTTAPSGARLPFRMAIAPSVPIALS